MNREIVGGGGAAVYPLVGDVTSTPGQGPVTVTGIQNIPVIPSFPTGGEVMTYDGPSNTLSLEAPVQQIELETNGTPNGSQTRLNLVAGPNITITDDGTGDLTFSPTGGGGGITRSAITTNSDGSFFTWSDGLIEQWGQISVPSSGTEFSGIVITFPTSFVSAVGTFQATIIGLPNSGSFTDQASINGTSATVSGASVQMQCSVPVGGGGTTFNQAVIVSWYARGI